MRYEIDGELLTDIADAIREKTGKNALMTPEQMAGEISGISGGGSGATVIGYDSVDFQNTTNDSNIGDATTNIITTELVSSNRGGRAQSGSTQVICTKIPYDLTNVQSVIVQHYTPYELNSKTTPATVGVSNTIPSSYDEAISNPRRIAIKNGDYSESLLIDDLSGNYYIWYAVKLTYNDYGWTRASFKFILV